MRSVTSRHDILDQTLLRRRCCCCRSPWARRRRSCAAMAGRCARWRSRPTARKPISGSFDTSAIRWSLTHNVAEQVMRFHDNAVNAVAWLKDGRIVTAGADAHIAIWTPGQPHPDKVLDGHSGADRRSRAVAGRQDAGLGVVGSHRAAVAARRRRAARAQRQCAERQRRRLLAGRQASDQRRLRCDAAHLAVRPGGGVSVRNLPTPLNSVAVAPDGEIVTAGADGKVYFLVAAGRACAARCRPPPRRSSRSRSRTTASWSPPPASAARWRSSTARRASSSAR